MSKPSIWFYAKGDRRFGPMEETEIRALLERGIVAADALVWRYGLNNWTEAHNTELLPSEASVPAFIPTAPQDAEETFEAIVSGLQKIAATIVDLPAAKKDVAIRAAERSSYKLALSWGYPENRANKWAELVMVALHRAIEDQVSKY
jgi:hypothetical protein